MLGALVVTGVGALAFKLGMDSRQMLDEGYSASAVAASLPCRAAGTIASTVMSCYNSVSYLFTSNNKNNKNNKNKKQ